MLVTVLAYKTLSRTAEPEPIYLGSDRKKAYAMEVPEGFARSEVHLLAEPFKRKFSSTFRKEQETLVAAEKVEAEKAEAEKAEAEKAEASKTADDQPAETPSLVDVPATKPQRKNAKGSK